MGIVAISAIISVAVYCFTFGDLVARVTEKAEVVRMRGGFEACKARAEAKRAARRHGRTVWSEGDLTI